MYYSYSTIRLDRMALCSALRVRCSWSRSGRLLASGSKPPCSLSCRSLFASLNLLPLCFDLPARVLQLYAALPWLLSVDWRSEEVHFAQQSRVVCFGVCSLWISRMNPAPAVCVPTLRRFVPFEAVRNMCLRWKVVHKRE